MKKRKIYGWMLPVYLFVLIGFFVGAHFFSSSVTTIAETTITDGRTCVIIDAGHGGVDGGATSCTGVLESKLNLDVATRLNDLLHLLGIKTKMIRTDDISIFTKGSTIAAKKVSDLKERIRIVNTMNDSVLISIHMNYFTDSRYYGPQVFYASTQGSKDFANCMQASLNHYTGTERQTKQATGVYLMQNIQRTGILVECGFISNPVEEAKLCDSVYQKKLCCIMAANTAVFLANT